VSSSVQEFLRHITGNVAGTGALEGRDEFQAPGRASAAADHDADGVHAMSRNGFHTARVCGAARGGFFAAFVAALLVGQVQEALAQPGPSGSSGGPAEARASSPKGSIPRKETSGNRYTAGFVTGAPQSTEFVMVQEIATTLARGQETGPHGEMALRVLPMVGSGGVRSILDVLTLAGADMAIAPVVLVDRLRDARTFGDIRSKLVYIASLHTEEFHVLARPEIGTLADLAGKPVNLGEEGSAGAVLGREVLEDVKISEVNLDLDAALEGMRNGRIFATLLLSGKPVEPLLARNARIEGIRFLPIPYSQAFQRDYLPTTIRHEDYPNIIAAGESVDTIAIKSALFAYNWPAGSERFQLLELFVQTFFSRFPEFLGDAHHPKWREVNFAARLPGWERFRPAERWLQRQSPDEAALRNAFDQFLRQDSNSNPPDREALFQEFLRWWERNHGR
jgi:uncharacterized protein